MGTSVTRSHLLELQRLRREADAEFARIKQGSPLGERIIGEGAGGRRVAFREQELAHALMAPLLDTTFAVRLTTYPSPRISDPTGAADVVAATLDFAAYTWVVDVVSRLRDLACLATSTPLGTHARSLSIPRAVAVLHALVNAPPHVRAALDSAWRVGGVMFAKGVVVDTLDQLDGMQPPRIGAAPSLFAADDEEIYDR